MQTLLHVMATTRPMFNSSTSNKSQGWISSKKHKLCNLQENLIGNYNSILLTIYISVLNLYYNFSTPTLMSMLCSHVYYLSTSCSITYPPCIYLKTSMLYTCALTSYSKPYSLISIIYVYTMRKPCFLILLHL